MNAVGTYLPPMFIFPRKRMVASLVIGAPYQYVGCRCPNGWTDSGLSVKWLEHFASFTTASVDIPQIVILDGHHSHKTLAAVEYARSRGITLITLPPHCTHKMHQTNPWLAFGHVDFGHMTQISSPLRTALPLRLLMRTPCRQPPDHRQSYR